MSTCFTKRFQKTSVFLVFFFLIPNKVTWRPKSSQVSCFKWQFRAYLQLLWAQFFTLKPQQDWKTILLTLRLFQPTGKGYRLPFDRVLFINCSEIHSFRRRLAQSPLLDINHLLQICSSVTPAKMLPPAMFVSLSEQASFTGKAKKYSQRPHLSGLSTSAEQEYQPQGNKREVCRFTALFCNTRAAGCTCKASAVLNANGQNLQLRPLQ